MGLLLVLGTPTPGMVSTAKKAGLYNVPVLEKAFPKVQILTVAELLAGTRPQMPTPITPYVKAKYNPSPQIPLL